MTAETRGSQNGFLLVELLVALGLLAVALLALTPMFVMAGKQNAAASDMTFATTLAQEKSESLKATYIGSLAAGSDVISLRGLAFDRVWTITADAPQTGMKTVTVTVTSRRKKTDCFGPARTATVTTYRVP